MSGWPSSEAELARVVVADLRERGWTVYQEVELGDIADIVAVRGRFLWVIETKRTLGLDVLAQARSWLGLAHFVSVAVPLGRRSKARHLAEDVARGLGIGVLHVHDPRDWATRYKGSPVIEEIKPGRLRRPSEALRQRLRPEQQHYAEAGNAEGKRYTPFTATCDALRRALDLDGPLTVREAVKRLHGLHHYASEVSARGALMKWAKLGKIEGVEWVEGKRREPGRLRLKEKPKR